MSFGFMQLPPKVLQLIGLTEREVPEYDAVYVDVVFQTLWGSEFTASFRKPEGWPTSWPSARSLAYKWYDTFSRAENLPEYGKGHDAESVIRDLAGKYFVLEPKKLMGKNKDFYYVPTELLGEDREEAADIAAQLGLSVEGEESTASGFTESDVKMAKELIGRGMEEASILGTLENVGCRDPRSALTAAQS